MITPPTPPAASITPASFPALRCPTCDSPTVAGARFCHVCGTPLTSSRAGAAAERRVVTVLFGDLSDFTAWAEDLDPERVGEVTDRVLAGLARAVVEVGGHVDKLTGDGIMAVFGAPTAHEDDAERAVRAAVTMQREVGQLIADELGGGRTLGLRVGLNTGEVLAGIQAALSYTVVGDTVNTASRLSDAASVGSVFAGRDTAISTMTLASWRALAPLRLKGKREPVAAYELVALRPSTAGQLGLGDEAPFIGRDAEVALLVEASLEVSDLGRPSVVAVSGEAGVGKSRLVGELIHFAGELPDMRVLRGRAMPYGEIRHLGPLLDLVRTACGSVDGEEASVVADKVRRTLARLEQSAPSLMVSSALADRLLHLLGISPDDGSASPEGAPGDAHGRDGVLDAVAALLRALAVEGPLLVVLDDLQWASDELRDAIGEVTRRLRGPVLVVLIGREPPSIPGVQPLQRINLGPLDEPTAGRLLRAYLGGGDLAEPLRSAMLGRAQGNPYFLAELLHLLVDRGLLLREGDAWVASGPLPSDALPAACNRCSRHVSTAWSRTRNRCCGPRRCSACASRQRRSPSSMSARTARSAPRSRPSSSASSSGRPAATRCGGPSRTRWRATSRTAACRRPTGRAGTPAPRNGPLPGRSRTPSSTLRRGAGRAGASPRRLDEPAGRRSGTRRALRRLRRPGAARPAGAGP